MPDHCELECYSSTCLARQHAGTYNGNLVSIAFRISISDIHADKALHRCCRFLGTLCATAVFQWRAWNYPKNYSYVYTPLATFMFVAPELAEVAYPFVFWHLSKSSDGKIKDF